MVLKFITIRLITFQRKFNMHDQFSESAFGSELDKKIDYRELSKDLYYQKKYSLIKDKNNDDKEKRFGERILIHQSINVLYDCAHLVLQLN